MNFEEKINEEIKKAVKSGDKIRLETMRSLRAAIIEFNKSGAGREMNEEDVLKILNSQAKKRKDAIKLYKQGSRDDLAEKEARELAIIEEFLPEQTSEEEAEKIIREIASSIGASEPKDFGKLMGATMKELKGKIDGSKAQAIAKKILGLS